MEMNIKMVHDANATTPARSQDSSNVVSPVKLKENIRTWELLQKEGMITRASTKTRDS